MPRSRTTYTYARSLEHMRVAVEWHAPAGEPCAALRHDSALWLCGSVEQ